MHEHIYARPNKATNGADPSVVALSESAFAPSNPVTVFFVHREVYRFVHYLARHIIDLWPELPADNVGNLQSEMSEADSAALALAAVISNSA
jgi:hypothetical protein